MGKELDLSGQKIGKLTLLRKEASKKTRSASGKISCRARYLCRCECGNERVVFAGHIRTKKTRAMCKACAYAARPQSTRRFSDWERQFKLRVGKNRHPVSISAAEYQEIASQNCGYCGDPPQLTVYGKKNKFAKEREAVYVNGIDRLDSSIGYHFDNCIACCWKCNIMKNTMGISEFYKHLFKILKHAETRLSTLLHKSAN